MGPAMARDRIVRACISISVPQMEKIAMYKKRLISEPLDKLKTRLEAAKSIQTDFDFGNGINADAITQFSNELETAINGYNQTLSDADELRDTIRTLERKANDISDRLLSLIGGSYGKDSLEYQRMGGTRKSEIQYSGTRPETYEGNGSAGDTSSDTESGSTT